MNGQRALLAAGLAACLSVQAHAQSGEAPAGAASCSGCHAQSAGVQTAVPRLHGRPAQATVTAMKAFQTGKLAATVMDRIAKGFTDDEIAAIAAWYAVQR